MLEKIKNKMENTNWRKMFQQGALAAVTAMNMTLAGCEIQDSSKFVNPNLFDQNKEYQQKPNEKLAPQKEKISLRSQRSSFEQNLINGVYQKLLKEELNYPALNAIVVVNQKDPTLKDEKYWAAVMKERSGRNNKSPEGANSENRVTSAYYNEDRKSNPERSPLSSYLHAVSMELSYKALNINLKESAKLKKDSNNIKKFAQGIRGFITVEKNKADKIESQNTINTFLGSFLGSFLINSSITTLVGLFNKNSFNKLYNKSGKYIPNPKVQSTEQNDKFTEIFDHIATFPNTIQEAKDREYRNTLDNINYWLRDNKKSRNYLTKLLKTSHGNNCCLTKKLS